MEEYNEYETFFVTAQSGEEVELAVVDRFTFDEKHYIAAARVEGDEILDDGVFVYKSIKRGEDISYERIEDADEYAKVAEYYSTIEE